MFRLIVGSLVAIALALAPLGAGAQPSGVPGAAPDVATSTAWVPAPRPGQTPQPVQPAPAPKASPRPLLNLPGQPVNVRIEVMITDQRAGEPPIQKTVALVLADRTNGMVRSEASLRNVGDVPLHVDAEAALVDNGRVLVQIGLDYRLPGAGEDAGKTQPDRNINFAITTQIRESIRAILRDGEALTVAESADPITDRKVKVEVKATILK